MTPAGQVMDGVGMTGVTANMGTISDLGVSTGRFITEFDDQRHTNVAFIGEDVRDRFFRDTDPIGKTISLDGKPFEVAGVSDKKGSAFGRSQDNFVMIPLGTFFKIFGTHQEAGFNALAIDHEHLDDAQDEVRVLLRAHRKLRPNQEDNFGLLSSSSLVALWDRITKTLATMAVGIVSVFMVVANGRQLSGPRPARDGYSSRRFPLNAKHFGRSKSVDRPSRLTSPERTKGGPKADIVRDRRVGELQKLPQFHTAITEKRNKDRP